MENLTAAWRAGQLSTDREKRVMLYTGVSYSVTPFFFYKCNHGLQQLMCIGVYFRLGHM